MRAMVPAACLSVVWLLAGRPHAAAAGDTQTTTLEREFVAPPDTARMWTWWFWLGDKVDEKSITADLEAFKAQGVAGVTVYSLSGPGVPGKGPPYMSAEWRALWKHTLKEADRLGLGVSTMLCSGWNAGGPWIQPEQACKKHVSSQQVVTGPQHFKGILPQPATVSGFYRDAAVSAFPVRADAPAGETATAGLLALKTLDHTVSGQAPTREINEAARQPLPAAAADTSIDPLTVVDLTARCGADGVLEWDVPAGRWTILRSGYTLTGARTSWSSPTGNGLEADPLDATAMDFQFANTAAPLIEDAGPLAGKVLRSVQIDSWEIEHPNWTPALMDDFRRLRGYDPRPYLPALAGYRLGHDDLGERFLYDYRKTVGDLVADHYYGRLSTLATARGIVQQSEAGGVCSPTSMALDCLKNLGKCAIPMGEFWQDGAWVENQQNKNGKQTASAAHLYGKPIVAAEAFTSFIHWLDSPATLKPTADRAFCEGFNRFFIFSSATRSEDGYPGTEFCAGTHFNRKITWWQQARGFSDYIARCSHLLQQGRFVADVLFYNGDACPNFVPPKQVDPSLGPGYDYDVCNSEILLTRVGVVDGRIVLPADAPESGNAGGAGITYRLLVLPECVTMPVEVLAKLKACVAAGMTVIGPRPARAPGLKDYPQCDRQVIAMADELWGDCDGKSITEHAYGHGRVVWGKTIREVLDSAGVKPDFCYSGARPGAFLDWIHRRAGSTDIYFIANRLDRAEKACCTFRVSGRQPELWNPVTGERRDLPQFEPTAGGTSVPLEFEPHESMFVVFRTTIQPPPAERSHASPNFPARAALREIEGPWSVRFDPQWLYPLDGLSAEQVAGSFTFDHLTDWRTRPEPAVRHFSGTAVYQKDFGHVPDESRGSNRIWLDLGVVKDVARVRLNGRDLGVVWCPPWRVDITGAIEPGRNTLRIEVVNLWPNRLLGDGLLPAGARRTQTNFPAGPKQSLLPSGLLGPVGVCEESPATAR